MDPRTKNLEGQTFGQWTVLSYAGMIKQNAHWYCRCTCGFEKPVKAQYLLGGVSRKCQTCAIPKRANITGEIPYFYWRHVIGNAKKRDIQIEVTKEKCYDILVSQDFKCAISGLPIEIAKSSADHNEGKTTASLDRIDSYKPYELGNVQWVHKDINMMKHIFSLEYFINLCQAVVNHLPSYHDDQLQ